MLYRFVVIKWEILVDEQAMHMLVNTLGTNGSGNQGYKSFKSRGCVSVVIRKCPSLASLQAGATLAR